MEEKYALQARQLSFILGVIAFIVFLFMLKPILKDAPEPLLGCGNKSPDNVGKTTEEGKRFFINNCASCHAKSMTDALTGPPLVYWQQYLGDEKELLFYLKNPAKYPKKRMNQAFRALHKAYAPAQCVAFPSLKEEDVAALVAYIKPFHSY
jgi:mono/diheme cytochrome c family protein